MTTERAERRLAAIMFTDIVGYTALIFSDFDLRLFLRGRLSVTDAAALQRRQTESGRSPA